MRKLFLTIFIILLLILSGHAQSIKTVKLRSQSDITVHITDKPYKADLIAFKVKSRHRANNSRGLLYFTSYQFETGKKVYFTSNQFGADLIIYFTDKEYKAKWNRTNKRHLLQ